MEKGAEYKISKLEKGPLQRFKNQNSLIKKFGEIGVTVYKAITGKRTTRELHKDMEIDEDKLYEILSFMEGNGMIMLESVGETAPKPEVAEKPEELKPLKEVELPKIKEELMPPAEEKAEPPAEGIESEIQKPSARKPEPIEPPVVEAEIEPKPVRPPEPIEISEPMEMAETKIQAPTKEKQVAPVSKPEDDFEIKPIEMEEEAQVETKKSSERENGEEQETKETREEEVTPAGTEEPEGTEQEKPPEEEQEPETSEEAQETGGNETETQPTEETPEPEEPSTEELKIEEEQPPQQEEEPGISPVEKIIKDKYGDIGIKVYTLIDGQKTAEEIMKETGISESKLVEILDFMDEEGIIKLEYPGDKKKAPPKDEKPSTSTETFSPMLEESEQAEKEIFGKNPIEVPIKTPLNMVESLYLRTKTLLKYGENGGKILESINGRRDVLELSLLNNAPLYETLALMYFLLEQKGIMMKPLTRTDIRKKYGDDGYSIYKRYGKEGVFLYELVGKDMKIKDMAKQLYSDISANKEKMADMFLFIHQILKIDVPVDRDLLYREFEGG